MALGWLTLAAASPNQNGATAHKPEAAQSVQRAPAPVAPRAAPEPTQPIQAQEYYRPCDDTQNDGGSDLCAQWRTAKWTKIAAIFGILGFGGVLFALGLSIMSTRAAVRSNEIADETAKRGLRAYIIVLRFRIRGLADGKTPVFSYGLKNVGQTPAYDVFCVGKPFGGNDETAGMTKIRLKEDQPFLGSKVTLGAGQEVTLTYHFDGPVDQHFVDAVLKEEIWVVFAGVVSYRDIYKRQRRVTFKMFVNPVWVNKKGRGRLAICEKGNRSN